MAKRFRLLSAALFLLFLFSACGGGANSGSVVSADGLQQAIPGGQAGGDGAEIALFITEEQKNHGLGQAVWNAVSRFSGEEGVTYGTYVIDAADVDATLATIDLAIKGSARVIVAIGDEMAAVVERAQVLYTELQFILLGVEEAPALRSNAVLLEYDELQAGWLAGYAAVLEGYRVLAFVETVPALPEGGDMPEAQEPEEEAETDSVTTRRNLGFVLGAEAAAKDMSLEPGGVQVQTLRLTGEENTTERRETIANLYQSGVELLFAGDGAAQNDALRVARGFGTSLIGISLSFVQDDAANVASVDKAPGQPLYSLLRAWKNGGFPQERVYYCGLEHEGFTLESTGFTRFTASQYSTIVARFAGGSYAAALHLAARDEDGELADPLGLATEYVFLVASQIDEGTGMFQPPAYYAPVEEPEEETVPDGNAGASGSVNTPAASGQAEEEPDEADGEEADEGESGQEESGLAPEDGEGETEEESPAENETQ